MEPNQSSKDQFSTVTINGDKRDVLIKFLKVIKPHLRNSPVPLLANEDFIPDVEEMIEHFEGLSLAGNQQVPYDFSLSHSAYLSAIINFSNSQKPTETFLTEEEDDLFWDFIDEVNRAN